MDIEPESYEFEMYGGLVETAVRAARGFEMDDTSERVDDGLDRFMKEIYLFKQALYRHVIDAHDSQSPNINYIYEGILSQIYRDLIAGDCRPAIYEIPDKVALRLTKICDMFRENEGDLYEHWLRRLMKDCPYAYNIRSAKNNPSLIAE